MLSIRSILEVQDHHGQLWQIGPSSLCLRMEKTNRKQVNFMPPITRTWLASGLLFAKCYLTIFNPPKTHWNHLWTSQENMFSNLHLFLGAPTNKTNHPITTTEFPLLHGPPLPPALAAPEVPWRFKNHRPNEKKKTWKRVANIGESPCFLGRWTDGPLVGDRV